MRGVLAIALVLAGCQQLFGLDDIHVQPDAPPDGAPVMVTGRYLARVASNDSTFQPVVTDVPFASVTATVRLADGTMPAVTWNADGTFAFPSTSGEMYALRLSANGLVHEYQLSASTLDLAEPVMSRLDRAPAATGTTVTYNLTSAPPSGASTYIGSTGQWSETYVGGNQSSYSVDWGHVITQPAMGTLAPIGLLDTSHHDRLFLTIFEPAFFAGTYATIYGYRVDDVAMTSGVPTTINMQYVTPTTTSCVHVQALRSAELQRLTAAGYGTSFAGSVWSEAVPLPELGIIGDHVTGYTIDGATTDLDGDVQAANPYDHHVLALRMMVLAQRDVTAAGATMPAAIASGSYHWVQAPDEPTCTSTTTVSGMVALPGQPTLAGSALDTDDQQIVIDRTQAVPLTWPVTGRFVDTFHVALVELAADPTGATVFLPVVDIFTPTQSAAIDPALLKRGSTYLILVQAQLGFPNAPAGDFRTRGFPFALGQFTSHTFQIAD